MYTIFPNQIVHRQVQTHYTLVRMHSRSRLDIPKRLLDKHLHQRLCQTQIVSDLEEHPRLNWSEMSLEGSIFEIAEESIRIPDR